MKTEEEKKEAKRKSNRKQYLANKEKFAAYYKKYNSNADNKAKAIARTKAHIASHKDGLFTVYCLPEENYVGMTTCLRRRLHVHKSLNNRNVKGAYVLSKHKTKREALDTEASYHAKGYNGSNHGNGFKKGNKLWQRESK